MIGSSGTDGPIVAIAGDGVAAPCGLSAEECRTCAALPRHVRADWRASRHAAKEAAGTVLGVPERVLRAEPPVHGSGARLRLLGPRDSSRPAPVSLSISHRDGRGAAVADAPGVGLGIDLERADAVPAAAVRFFTTAAERDAAAHLTAAQLWALKEAAWKAVGCGEDTPFTAMRLRFDGQSRLRAVELLGRSFAAQAEITTPWDGYVLAVVWLEGDRR